MEDAFEDYVPEKEIVKKGNFNKKWMMPLVIIMILGAGLIVGAVVYNYIYRPSNSSFVKVFTANINTANPTQNVSVLTGGDNLNNELFTCNGNDNCSSTTGLITLINTDPTAWHSCSVNTTESVGNNYVDINYSGIPNFNPSNIDIAPNGTINFTISYSTSTNGTYSMNTTINCP